MQSKGKAGALPEIGKHSEGNVFKIKISTKFLYGYTIFLVLLSPLKLDLQLDTKVAKDQDR
jgi:hypothetical protein